MAALPETAHVGNLGLLDEPLTALFCSQRCPGDLILKTYDLARAMRDAGVSMDGRLPDADGKGVPSPAVTRREARGRLPRPQHRLSSYDSRMTSPLTASKVHRH